MCDRIMKNGYIGFSILADIERYNVLWKRIWRKKSEKMCDYEIYKEIKEDGEFIKLYPGVIKSIGEYFLDMSKDYRLVLDSFGLKM